MRRTPPASPSRSRWNSSSAGSPVREARQGRQPGQQDSPSAADGGPDCRLMSTPTNASGRVAALDQQQHAGPAGAAGRVDRRDDLRRRGHRLAIDRHDQIAALQALFGCVAGRVDRGDDHARERSPAGWRRARSRGVSGCSDRPSACCGGTGNPVRRCAGIAVGRRRSLAAKLFLGRTLADGDGSGLALAVADDLDRDARDPTHVLAIRIGDGLVGGHRPGRRRGG